MKRFLAIALACGFASTTWAQAPGQTPTKQQQPKETKRDRVKKRIRALRAYTLTEELGLNEADAGKLFPVLSKYDDEFDRLLAERQLLQHDLDSAGDLKDKKEIEKLIDRSVANQRATWDAEDKRLGEIRKILTPAQVARMLVVLPALERRIQNQLRNALKNGGGGGGGGLKKKAGAPPMEDEDDDEVEPSEKPAPKKPAGNPAPNRPGQPCDPYSSVHGCR